MNETVMVAGMEAIFGVHSKADVSTNLSAAEDIPDTTICYQSLNRANSYIVYRLLYHICPTMKEIVIHPS